MNILSSLHTHTVFSDGDNTAREMIETALSCNAGSIGFTDHSFTAFDLEYCMREDRVSEYRKEIASLKEEYKDRIKVYCGIEQDYYSVRPEQDHGYDYIIGSVHYVRIPCTSSGGGEESDIFIPVDDSIDKAAEVLLKAADDYFCGDIYSLAEEYFRAEADVVNRTSADIIGHFDVLTKCNTRHHIFDTDHPRYREAWKKAADSLIRTGRKFEINLSPLLRGIKPEPYPSHEITEYIKKTGGQFIVTGDCHSTVELEQFFEYLPDFFRERDL